MTSFTVTLCLRCTREPEISLSPLLHAIRLGWVPVANKCAAYHFQPFVFEISTLQAQCSLTNVDRPTCLSIVRSFFASFINLSREKITWLAYC